MNAHLAKCIHVHIIFHPLVQCTVVLNQLVSVTFSIFVNVKPKLSVHVLRLLVSGQALGLTTEMLLNLHPRWRAWLRSWILTILLMQTLGSSR